MIRRVIQESKALAPWATLVDRLSVTFDDHSIQIYADLPQGELWSHKFQWNDVVRVCFVAEGVNASDGIYVFTRERSVPYPIPTEASGGPQIWGEIIRRNLFPAELAIGMVTTEGKLFVWPPHETGTTDPVLASTLAHQGL